MPPKTCPDCNTTTRTSWANYCRQCKKPLNPVSWEDLESDAFSVWWQHASEDTKPFPDSTAHEHARRLASMAWLSAARRQHQTQELKVYSFWFNDGIRGERLHRELTLEDATNLWQEHKPLFLKAAAQELYAEMVIRIEHSTNPAITQPITLKHAHSSDFLLRDGLWYEVSEIQ